MLNIMTAIGVVLMICSVIFMSLGIVSEVLFLIGLCVLLGVAFYNEWVEINYEM